MKYVIATLLFVALSANAKTLIEAVEELRAGQFQCFLNSDVKAATNLIAWQQSRIAELERQLATQQGER